jgi:hypothetical protein
LLPIQGEPILRTQFGHQVARGIADSLGLRVFSESEVKRAFESIDLDGNNIIDAEEVLELIESVYLTVYGRQPSEDERNIFFGGFRGLETGRKSYSGLSREQLTGNLMALQQELEGGSEGSELVEVRTEADAQRMIARFSPALKNSLDQVFDELSSGGEVLTEAEMNKFLLKVNEQLGRGGTARHAAVVFNKRKEAFQPAVLSRQEWYGVFARELGEGKWWQVVYDLEEFGAKLRPTTRGAANAPLKVCPHYQGWLDYVFFTTDQLACAGVQESLTTSERSRVYDDGDALPNEWHPSDHLPVAAVFVWKQEP